MTKFVSVLPAAVAIVALATLASAGVVVEEQQIVGQPNGKQVTRMRTVMIEGDKQKSIIDDGKRTVITDLGKGTMTMLDDRRKTYVEIPFPPKQAGTGASSPTIGFKKTGGHDKILGYSCDEYSGAGMVGANSVSMSGCFSDSAPGADDYRNFQREMAEKAKGTPVANMAQIPPGVPLRLTITTTMGNVPATGMSPEMANKLNQMLAHRQFVTNTRVAKITPKSLSADLFQVPPGYQKQQSLPKFGAAGGGAPMPPPAEHKVPE